MVTEYLYRYSDVMYAPSVDEYDNPVGTGRLVVELSKYPIARRTPKGCWIYRLSLNEKFVLLTGRKRFACETQEEAMDSFVARKCRQIKILKAQLKRAEQALSYATMKPTLLQDEIHNDQNSHSS
jgi:hypothetical protein